MNSLHVAMLRHPATGLLLLTPVTLYAFYQGFAGRREKNAKKKRVHANLMPWLFGATLLSAYDGTCAMKTWDNARSLTSIHAIAGAVVLAALFGQAVGSQFLSSERSRDIHTYIGTATAALLLVHVGTGLYLYSRI